MADERVVKLLREAAEWRLISMLLGCPQGDWQSQVAALAAEVHDEKLQRSAAAMAREASEGLYHTIFGPGGPAAPREVSHREYVVPGQSLAELQAYYDVFAFRPATDEPPDHVAVEADFVAYLYLKGAYAMSRADYEQGDIAADAAGRFVADHLASIAEPLAQSLEHSGIAYLQIAADALLERVGPVRYAGPAPSPALPMLEEEILFCCDAAVDSNAKQRRL